MQLAQLKPSVIRNSVPSLVDNIANLQCTIHFLLTVRQGTSVIANHLQIEAAIRMVISTAPNVARDVPNDSTLMIFLCSNVLLEKSKFVNFVSSLLYSCNGLK